MKKILLSIFLSFTCFILNAQNPCDTTVITITVSTVSPTCSGNFDGQANITITGGVSPYVLDIWALLPVFGWTPYSTLSTDTLGAPWDSIPGPWDGPGIIGPPNTLYSGPQVPAGSYFGTVTDANGCVATSDTVTINNPNPLNVFVTTISPTCNGVWDGEANITIEGGTEPWLLDIWTQIPFFGFTPYTSLSTDTLATIDTGGGWDPLGILGTPNTLYSGPQVPAGVYFGTVTDANGCYFSSDTVTISEPDAIDILVNTIDESAIGANDGTATPIISGGTAPYDIDWSGQDPAALSAGTYVVSVTDANMCDGSASFTIGTLSLNETNPYSISLYPNPVKDNLTIAINLKKNEIINIQLFDYLGNIVQNIKESELMLEGKKLITLNVSHFSKGFYFLKFENNNNIFTTESIIIN